MRTFWKVAGIVGLVALLGGAALAAVAVAQAPEQGNTGLFSDLRQEMRAAVARILGIEVERYKAAVDQARDEVLQQAVEEGRLTQQQADRMRAWMGQGLGPGMMGPGGRGGWGRTGPGGGWGMMGGYGPMMGGPQNSLVAVAAEKLGMTVQELIAQLNTGKTIAAIADEKGVEPQAIADEFLAQHRAWLSQAVADGRITQAQADLMQDHMEEMVQAHLNGTLPMGGYGPGGCGGMRQGRWQGTEL